MKQVTVENEKQILVIRNNGTSGYNIARINTFALKEKSDLVDNTIDKVDASISSAEIIVGKTASVSLANARSLSGTAIDIEDATVSYKSSDTTVATVNASGVVTAKKAGSATITAVVEKDNGFAVATVNVTVKESAFSDAYAFVREAKVEGKTKYLLTLFAGIKSLQYDEAGFELKLGNGTKTLTTQNVYGRFSFTNSGANNWLVYVRPADFALDSGYIYYVEFKLSEDEINSAMDITAFVTDANDNQIKGETVTVAAK